MAKILNIREILRHSKYSQHADEIATKIEGWGMDNEYDIHNLASHGMINGINPNLIVATILAGVETDDQPVPDAPVEGPDLEPDWLRATAAANDLAEEHNIDLSEIDGTGKDGTVVKSDVERHLLEEDEHDD
jgi:pyruvate/2-oxoglutarate dehydrogenase complex dihydrolipoamide acyltransferase (E2) component